MDNTLTGVAFTANYTWDSMNRMTGVTFPGGSVSYGWDSLGRRTSVTRGNGTSTQFAYEDDSDLDWMRHVFAGGATASAPADSWMGIDYGYDASGRLTLMASTDSRIMGSLPAAGSYGAANVLNQVATVPGRAAMTWSDAGNLATDGRGWSYTHDGFNRLIRAQSSSGTVVTHGYDTDGIRMETVLNPTGSVNGMPNGIGFSQNESRIMRTLVHEGMHFQTNADRHLIMRDHIDPHGPHYSDAATRLLR